MRVNLINSEMFGCGEQYEESLLSEVRAEIQELIDFQKKEAEGKPWMRQAQYRLAGLEDAIAIIDRRL